MRSCRSRSQCIARRDQLERTRSHPPRDFPYASYPVTITPPPTHGSHTLATHSTTTRFTACPRCPAVARHLLVLTTSHMLQHLRSESSRRVFESKGRASGVMLELANEGSRRSKPGNMEIVA